jgi:L-fuculose-phosphate aldolase
MLDTTHVRTRKARRHLVSTVRQMKALGLVAGTVGNASTRVDGGLLITPTRTPYEILGVRDIVAVTLADQHATHGWGRASTELPLHALIYKRRVDVNAVIHTHSIYATAWSFLARPLRPRLEDLDYHEIADVQTSELGLPLGSEELAERGLSALGESRAALLGGHGLVAVGRDLSEALRVAEVVEHQAHIAWLLRDHDEVLLETRDGGK